MAFSDWACLPRDMLESILLGLENFYDFVGFCSVCKPWRLIAQNAQNPDILVHKQKLLRLLQTCHNQLPLLLLTTVDANNNLSNTLYDLILKRVVYDNFQLPSPYNTNFFVGKYKHFISSSYGWLAFIENSSAITLVNPFINKIISLPEIGTPSNYFQHFLDNNNHQDLFIYKLVLSADPCLHPNEYYVGVIYGGMHELAFYRPGNKTWTLVADANTSLTDILFLNNQVIAANRWRSIISVDLTEIGTDTSTCSYKTITRSHARDAKGRRVKKGQGKRIVCPDDSYLLELHSELIMVERFLPRKRHTSNFRISKLVLKDEEKKKYGWVRVKGIGDQAMFLGDNQSISVAASEFPGCRGNCIYYTSYSHHVMRDGYHDAGVFDMADSSVVLLHDLLPGYDDLFLPVMWILPNLKSQRGPISKLLETATNTPTTSQLVILH